MMVHLLVRCQTLKWSPLFRAIRHGLTILVNVQVILVCVIGALFGESVWLRQRPRSWDSLGCRGVRRNLLDVPK